jgi:CubicO group peptidase (beta-lactamase class C family)
MKRRFFLLAACWLMVLMVSAQTKEQKNILDNLDRYYQKTVTDWDIPGMSVAIVKDGKIIFSKGYGVLEAGKATRPDGNSLYAIASNTKAFTATMIGQLVDEGKCTWNDKVQQHLPWFEVYDPAISSQVTLRDLLSHRVGYGTFSGDVIWYRSNLSAGEIIRGAKHLPPAFEFRAGFGYSNIMFITAGKVIEAITGKSWFENVQERLLQPLGMTRTTIFPEALPQLGNVATPHARLNERNIPIEYTSWAEIAAMGGLISSVNDVAQWMIFNLNHGSWNETSLISASSLNLIMTPHNNHVVDHSRPNDTKNHFNGYGLGWSLRDYHGRLMAGHTGGYDGMISAVTLIPDEKLGVVVLTNGMQSPYMAATYQTIDAFLGVNAEKNWSDDLLQRTKSREKNDTRIADRKASRVEGTKPSLPLEKYTGTYHSAIYGNITVSMQGGILKMELEHSPELSSTLKHFHYDVFEIIWDYEQAWFQFGTVKFNTDNYLKVTGIDFDVPNDDIFFEELKPVKVPENGQTGR